MTKLYDPYVDLVIAVVQMQAHRPIIEASVVEVYKQYQDPETGEIPATSFGDVAS